MTATDESSFGLLLRRHRHALGLTQEEMAERAALSVRELAYLEQDKHLPRPGTIRLLGEALGLSEEEHARLRAAARGAPERPVVVRVNFPVPPTPFIGRERELAVIVELLRDETVRLLSLTGPGGSGKTRLAIRTAEEAVDAFPDGIVFVPLAALADPALVASTIAAVLGVKPPPDGQLTAALRAFLNGKRMLLLLDNFEHLLPAASLVSELVAACPQLTVLITSRAVLRLAAEREYPVPPLAIPAGQLSLGAEGFADYDAIRLFVQRARAVDPSFEITEENAEAVTEICRRVDGLPLAIELAAARLRLFPPRALLARLSNRFQFLTGGPGDLPVRQQTLRNTIDWSYNLLGPEQQRLFGQLAVFAGGCTLHAAEAICNVEGDMDLLGGLTSLIEQSLLRAEGTGEPRLTMLETIREYARERLTECGGDADTRERHAGYFLSLVQEAGQIRDTEDAAMSVRQLEADHYNFRAALDWCLAEPGREEIALQLAASLGWFWQQGTHWNEGHRRLEDVLQLSNARDYPYARALAVSALAELEVWRTNHAAARVRAEEAVVLWRSLQDPRGLARAVQLLSSIRTYDADHEGTRELLVEAVELWRSLGEPRRLSDALLGLGMSELHQGRLAAGRARIERSLEEDRALYSGRFLAQRLRILAHAAYRQGDAPAAQRYLGEAVSTARSIHDHGEAQIALCAVGWTAGALGEYDQACALLEEALALARRHRQPEMGNAGFSWLLNHLGDAARGLGDDARATACYEESLALFDQEEHVQGRAAAFHNLGHLALTRGDLRLAHDLFAGSLRGFDSIGFTWCAADCLAGLAGVGAHEGHLERSAILFGAAEAIHRSIDASGVFTQRVNEVAHERDIAQARNQTDEAVWNRAWVAGRAMGLEEAVAFALDEVR